MAIGVVRDADLTALNTFGVAARAARLVTLDASDDLDAALAATRADANALVLGGGSNVLFTGDFGGTILRVHTLGRRIVDDDVDAAIVEAQAGEPWAGFVRWTLERRLYGLENLSLIPGCVGASPIQNIGAYGVEMREHFVSLDAVHLASGERRVFDAQACRFAYRDSVFKHADGGGWVILCVRFRLARSPNPRFDYADLRDELARTGVSEPTPEDVARAVIAVRTRKLPDPAHLGNAGSFFKNPVLDPIESARLREREPTLPCWPSAGGVRFSAAWMIERCGFKGVREGDAGVHERHALVLVNHGHASGAQILALAERIRDTVADRFGVVLEAEPRIL